MASLIPGYEYDVFISYRQKDNKYDGWVTAFVDNLKKELEATFKEEISVYFDINPSDYLLETYDVNASLKDKLKCLVFIPIISRTYCDPNSFAWEHEFKAFVEQASLDQFGLKVKLPNGNVANRVLPVLIHNLDIPDIKECESIIGGVLRGIEFIYKEPGVNKPLTADDDEKKNLNNTKYRIQINKVANAIKEIVSGLKTEPVKMVKEKIQHGGPSEEFKEEERKEVQKKPDELPKRKLFSGVVILALLIITGIIVYPKIFKKDEFKDIKDADGRISVAVMPFKNMTGDSLYNKWQDSFQNLIISNISNTDKLSVRSFETMMDIIGSTGHTQYASITPSIAKDIALKLESGTIVLGSLSKAGENFRINIQLMKAKSTEIYKAFTLDCKGENEFLIIGDSLSGLLKNFLRIEILKQDEPAELKRMANTSSPEAYICLVQAMKMMWSNNTSAAIEYLSKAVEYDTNFTSSYYMLAISYRILDNIKAKALLNKAEKGRDKLTFREQQFFDAFKYGYFDKNPQKAIQIFNQLAELESQNRFLLNMIGDLNRLMHSYDNEIEAYEKYIELDDKWGVIGKWIWPYVELGDVYHIKGDHKKEGELYEQALQISPDNASVIYRQAKCALSVGDTLKASVLTRKLESIYREQYSYGEVQLISTWGNLNQDAGKLNRAEQFYRQALNLNPKNTVFLNDLAWLLIENEINIVEGMKLVNQALDMRPDNYNFQYTKGLGLLKQGHYIEALDLLEKSWNQRPAYDYDHYLNIQEAKKAAAGMK